MSILRDFQALRSTKTQTLDFQCELLKQLYRISGMSSRMNLK